jgi:hypothetical protein
MRGGAQEGLLDRGYAERPVHRRRKRRASRRARYAEPLLFEAAVSDLLQLAGHRTTGTSAESTTSPLCSRSSVRREGRSRQRTNC